MTTFLLTAVGGAGRQASVTLAADFTVAVGRTRKRGQSRLNQTATQPEEYVQSVLLANVVIREHAVIIKLLATEDETLLVARDAFLQSDLAANVGDGLTGVHLEGNRTTRQGLDENLHGDCAAAARRSEISAV